MFYGFFFLNELRQRNLGNVKRPLSMFCIIVIGLAFVGDRLIGGVVTVDCGTKINFHSSGMLLILIAEYLHHFHHFHPFFPGFFLKTSHTHTHTHTNTPNDKLMIKTEKTGNDRKKKQLFLSPLTLEQCRRSSSFCRPNILQVCQGKKLIIMEKKGRERSER